MLTAMTRAGPSPARPIGEQAEPVVHPERTWFNAARNTVGAGPERSVSASRWTGFTSLPLEEVSRIAADCHVLAIALRPMDLTAFADKKLIHDGPMQPGTMRISEPELPLRGIFRGGYDALHLHITNAAIAECLESAGGSSPNVLDPFAFPQPAVDPVIERLAHALMHADDMAAGFGECYADSIGLAIVARLLARTSKGSRPADASGASKLPRWRLKRATEYIAAHLSEPIGLAEIAASTGLTRMHFAAQFRAATGLPPHEYLVRRRIDRAQQLLAASELSLAAIALEVGFKAQAHFTTVFSRIVGETPNAWRRKNYTGSPP
jgi:AraC-like DNA-binding protein